MQRLRLRPVISSAPLLTESAERLEENRGKLRSVLDPKNRLEELYYDQSAHASDAIERLQRCAPAIINMAMPDALFGILGRLGVERERAIVLVEQWISGNPIARSEVSTMLQNSGLDESAIEAEAILKCLPALITLVQLHASQTAIRDKGLSGLAFCREMLTKDVRPTRANPARGDASGTERISDQRHRKHDH